MKQLNQFDIHELSLPNELKKWIGNAPIYESSGKSNARTLYINRDSGAYLKIAPSKSLFKASQLQSYLAKYKLSSPVIMYLSGDKDYLLTESLRGDNGASIKYLSKPKKLSEVYGSSLRLLHEVTISDCPVKNRMVDLTLMASNYSFLQSHLDLISDYIGPACAKTAKEELLSSVGLLKNNVMIHGDYCLPNIILNDWVFKGFIDVADGGVGDRHYDLAWGLWSLAYNLKSTKYGHIFLDSYGMKYINKESLRICGLLAAME